MASGRMTRLIARLAALLLALSSSAAAAGDWRPLADDRLLVIDTSRGRMVILLQPEFAPRAVERILRLSRESVYDGLLFHRVIPGFVVQTGNPNNRDGGVSSLPDLDPEFTFRVPADSFVPIRPPRAPRASWARTLSWWITGRAAGGPTAQAWPAWDGRRGSGRPIPRSSSCWRPPGDWITTTPSGAGWPRGPRCWRPSPRVNPRSARTGWSGCAQRPTFPKPSVRVWR